MVTHRAVRISFDLAALQHNFQQVKHLAPHSRIMPVIKANAYGHGMLRVAQALDEADGFSVAQHAEALQLRQAGVDKPVTVFQGFADSGQLAQAFRHRLRPAISQLWQIELLEQQASSEPIDVWLKINTGMGRLGLQLAEVEDAWQRLQRLDCIRRVGLMAHFANVDDPQHPSNQQQVACFAELHQRYGAETSVSNSAAIISQLYPQQDWVRPGIMLYGASPLLHQSATELGLRPVMSVQATLIAINQLKRGAQVGYGYRWQCPEDMPVGIVNIGYGDGYPRHALDGTPLLVNGQPAKLIGRVSMDSLAVDLRGVEARCGDRVELWGQQLSVDEVAEKADTISYELLCNMGGSRLDIG